VYDSLAGGLFSGAITSQDVAVEKGSRFDPDRVQGAMYRKRYFKDAYFDAVKSIKDAADKEGLTLPEVALRWVMHHSALEKKKGDAVVSTQQVLFPLSSTADDFLLSSQLIGASSTKHIDQNLKDFEKAPLPQSIVDA
jgi:aflatoxin B1 aldehyde reductase